MPRDHAATAPLPVPTEVPVDDAYLEQVGHELRSPLTAIRTALGTLADDLADPDDVEGATRMLEIALRNTRRLEEAVDRHLRELESRR